MANYYLNMSYGKVGKTNAHFDYITANGKYTGKEKELVYESHNMPNWVTSAKEFWELADNNERVNGRTYREVRISLPEELTKEENIELLNQFLKENFSGHYYSVVIHDKETQPDFEFVEKHKNIHAHIMFCPRVIDDIERKDPGKYFKKSNSKHPEHGGAVKDEKWNEVETLLKLRKDWEILQNKHLEIHDIKARVSCKTLSKQRQEALEKGDWDKYDQLNRVPIHIDRNVLNKINKTEYEKKVVKEFLIHREIKSIKDEIYHQVMQERAKNKEIINEFNSTISAQEKDISFDEVTAKKAKIEQNNSVINNLKNLSIEREIYSNLIPEYKEKFEELNNLMSEKETFSEEEFNLLAKKYNDLKILESTISKEKFEKEKQVIINNIKNNIDSLDKENQKLTDEIKNIFSKNSNNQEFISNIENHYKNINSHQSINNIIFNLQEIEKINKKLALIDMQLENSRKTTLNILSNKKYIPLEKEVNKLREEITIKNSSGDTKAVQTLKELLHKKEKELKELEIHCTKDMNKFIRIKESFEKKLNNNRNELNIKLQAINKSLDQNYNDLSLSNKEVRKHLNDVIEKNDKAIELNKKKIEKLKFIKKSLNKDIKELEVIAYLSLTKGKFGKLQNNFSQKMKEIEKIDLELIKLKENKVFNMFSIRKLEKEKSSLENEAYNISKEFKELKASIPTDKLTDEILRIKTALNEKENKVDKELKELLNNNKELNTINTVCYNLFKDYKELTPKEIYNKSLEFLTSGNTKTHHTGYWNIKIENDQEKVIRL
ncbi:MobA/MobL family protein [Fusobacterium varium]|uniref:MobA/MobL family protein n=1 Tax=Fusobacterium varium TaxID=856 RepID=UPI002FE4C0C2